MQTNIAEKIEDTETVASIDPDLSSVDIKKNDIEAESASTKNGAPSPIPSGIKFMFGGVVVVVVLVITGVFLFTGSEHNIALENNKYIDPVSLVSGEKIKEKLENQDGVSVENLADDLISSAEAAPSFDKTDLNNFISANIISESIKPSQGVNKALQKIKSLLDEQDIDISQLNETLSRFKDEEFGKMSQQVQMISGEIKNIKTLVNKHYKELKSVHKKTSARLNRLPNKPPFKLVSIDVWGGQTNAVIFMHGKTSFAGIGDERAGWKIVSIDRPNCITTRNTVNNKRKKVCKKG